MYSEKYGVDKVRVLTFEKNRGKGGAIRMVNLRVYLKSICNMILILEIDFNINYRIR